MPILFALLTPSLAQQFAWGHVEGRIVWGDKPIPARAPIAAVENNADREHCLGAGPILSEEWIVNPKNRGLQGAFVWLAHDDPTNQAPLPVSPARKAMKAEAVIDTPCCMYTPAALGMREGQVLVIKNSSPVTHSSRLTGSQEGQSRKLFDSLARERRIEGLKADRLPIRVECVIHPWMGAWVRVFDHPYFAVTDADGKFAIKDAPAGKYRLVVWHGTGGFLGGRGGRQGRPITIRTGGVTDLGEASWK